jgi:hypothetical protein
VGDFGKLAFEIEEPGKVVVVVLCCALAAALALFL